MRHRLILPALVALAALVWIAIDQRVAADGRFTRPTTESAPTGSPASRIDAEQAVSSAPTPESATRSTTTTAAPAVAANADGQPTSASDSSESSGSRLAALERRARAGDPKAARDWTEAVMECAGSSYGEQFRTQPSHVRYLDWSQVQPRNALRAELLGSLVEECRLLFPQADEERAMLHVQSIVNEALALWAASGDPYGQLLAAHQERHWPPPLNEWRAEQALAVAHLNPGDPQTLVDLGEAFAEGSRFMGEAWTLAACDLGYDCAAGGALHRRMCLNQMYCFEGSYEAGLLQQLSPRQWQIVQSQRRTLFAMLQRGELAATFDVPPPGP